MKIQGLVFDENEARDVLDGKTVRVKPKKRKYEVGQILYVREPWAFKRAVGGPIVVYRADGAQPDEGWRSGPTMDRSRSRALVEVLDVHDDGSITVRLKAK